MLHAPRSTLFACAFFTALSALAPSSARAQTTGGGTGGWSTGSSAPGWSPIPSQPPPYVPPLRGAEPASALEIGTLYGFSAGYGIGTGIWLDAEFGIDDPGMRFLPPVILGLAAPVGVFFLDRPRMPRGMPAAIAMGMAIGAGEGVGIASYQYVTAREGDGWGFRAFSRSVFIGSTAGTALGTAAAFVMEPSPKTSLLLGSGVAWGMVIGSAFGYGSSRASSEFGEANDAAALGGLIGYNVGLLGTAALSTVWLPSFTSLAWMWIGLAAAPRFRSLSTCFMPVETTIRAGASFSKARLRRWAWSRARSSPSIAMTLRLCPPRMASSPSGHLFSRLPEGASCHFQVG